MAPSDKLGMTRRGTGFCGALAALIGLTALTGCVSDGPSFLPVAAATAPDDEAGTKTAATDTARNSSQDQASGKSRRVAVLAAAKPTPAKSARIVPSTKPENDAAGTRTVEVSDAHARIAAREAVMADAGGSISGSRAIDRLIEKHAEANGIPAALAYAVVRVESRYNPRARGSGVYGLSQIKPATARGLGFSGPADALLDADTNLTYGMKYLKGAWEQGGHDVCRAAMKYKGGHRTTRMSNSAARYCSAVKAHMAEVNKRRAPGGVETPTEKSFIETVVAAVTPTPAPEKAADTPRQAKVRGLIGQSRGALVPQAAPREQAQTVAAEIKPAAAKAFAATDSESRSKHLLESVEKAPATPAASAGATPQTVEDVLSERMLGFGQ